MSFLMEGLKAILSVSSPTIRHKIMILSQFPEPQSPQHSHFKKRENANSHSRLTTDSIRMEIELNNNINSETKQYTS